jgi:hypothetical protein
MIITDTTDAQWCYVKIPRTGTKAYTSLFDVDFANELKNNKFYPQGHAPYSSLSNIHGAGVQYFAVVRNPVDRFISSLRYMFERKATDPRISFVLPHDTIHNMVNFFYENFDRNCIPKGKTLGEIFNSTSEWFLGAFCKTQKFWTNDSSIRIFKYENISEFNDWLVNNFTYDISKLEHLDLIEIDALGHLDFTDPEFVQLAEHLFHEDFTLLNYPLTYITD